MVSKVALSPQSHQNKEFSETIKKLTEIKA